MSRELGSGLRPAQWVTLNADIVVDGVTIPAGTVGVHYALGTVGLRDRLYRREDASAARGSAIAAARGGVHGLSAPVTGEAIAFDTVAFAQLDADGLAVVREVALFPALLDPVTATAEIPATRRALLREGWVPPPNTANAGGDPPVDPGGPSTWTRSGAHTTAGLTAAAGIIPRNSAGASDPTNGRIVMIGIGMSNADQVGTLVRQQLMAAAWKHPKFRYLNCARSGRTADAWADDTDAQGAWSKVTSQLAGDGSTAAQVQAAHIVMTQAYPATNGAMTITQVRAIVANLLSRCPNVAIVFLSGISYTGYSADDRAPEPYPHDDSILMASLCPHASPLPVWAMFLDQWCKGSTANPLTGLTWLPEDVIADGVHPSDPTGRTKLATYVVNALHADAVCEGWLWVYGD